MIRFHVACKGTKRLLPCPFKTALSGVEISHCIFGVRTIYASKCSKQNGNATRYNRLQNSGNKTCRDRHVIAEKTDKSSRGNAS